MGSLNAWLSAVPGLLALAGLAAAVGGFMQRLKRVERDVEALKNVGTEVAVIAERTKNIDERLKGQDGKLDQIVNHFLDEARTFARQIVARTPPHA